MTHNHASQPRSAQSEKSGGFWRTRYALGLLVFGAVAGYFLWTEHRAHLQQWWPYALLLACPLMHVFMHKDHGGHGGNAGDSGTAGQRTGQNSSGS
ncbi:DUF2933 domain-containing protein [Cupriavidus campinensis]|uniref:DUF2933 domain-containing protein n=1 Tax=Cupriavidus campinensis TaxID=151783 RepID=UPI0024E2420B|nr:DUF2933 domain-containing protein [Cupriavidus campinensis]